jgi:hypothetical protein
MKTAAPLLTAGLAVFLCLCGCATSFETPVRKAARLPSPETLRVAVLPPRIHPDLEKENFKSDGSIGKQLADGRGIVVTSADSSRDIALEIVSALTLAGKYQRVFTVESEEEARRTGADTLMTVTVWDYRTALLGSNKNYFRMAPTSLLMSQYWMRWRTIEARFEWEVKLTSMEDGTVLYRNRLKKSYTAPVRAAFGSHFTDKMLSFLQNHAAPDYIGELFQLEMTEPPAEK